MRKVNYNRPVQPLPGSASTLRKVFGPGLSVAMTQRATEISMSSHGADTHRR